MRHPQLNKHGELQHLLTLDGLPRDILTAILDTAAPFTEVAEREVKALSTAVLRGVLDRMLDLKLDYSVNYVNAPGVARDRGIRVIDQRESGGVTVRVDDDGALSIDGFLSGGPLRLMRR